MTMYAGEVVRVWSRIKDLSAEDITGSTDVGVTVSVYDSTHAKVVDEEPMDWDSAGDDNGAYWCYDWDTSTLDPGGYRVTVTTTAGSLDEFEFSRIRLARPPEA